MSDRQSTHWEGCWQFDHHEKCARERIHVLEAQLAEAQERAELAQEAYERAFRQGVNDAALVVSFEYQLAAMREAIETYLDWGAKTGSDRDLLEQKFCDAVGRKVAGG